MVTDALRGVSMADIEKVIKGLECCITKPEHNCEECPYEGDGEGGWPCKSPEMKADALELLKKQKVKTVQRIMKTEDNGTYFTMIWYECEECGHKINGDDCFCAGCGREVDRSEVIHDT